MQIRELMNRRLETISTDATLRAAAYRMKALGIGALPVRRGDEIAGILTDRDITVRAVADGRDPEATRVEEAMTAKIIDCSDDDDLSNVARRMVEEKVRRLLVRDRSGNAVGIVSVDDLAASGEPIGLAPNQIRALIGSIPHRRRWMLALAPFAMWGIADGIWLMAAPRRWGRFWGRFLFRVARRRTTAIGMGALRSVSSAAILGWALRSSLR